jgi:glutathione S-transferase
MSQVTDPAANGLPVLWHLEVSHYNEKARWALDYKGIPHARHAVRPGRHVAKAKRLCGGTTFPVLVLDGRAIGDSTAIIAALEERHPEPPLYPAEPDARRRALALEDYFDEELGPYDRTLVFSHVLDDPDLLLGMLIPGISRAERLTARAAYPAIRRRVTGAVGIDDSSVEVAWRKLHAACARFQAELQPSGYLLGDGFTVADLTLAALLAPLVAPPQFPYPQPQRRHPLVAPLLEPLVEHGLVDWVHYVYAHHRGSSAEVRP